MKPSISSSRLLSGTQPRQNAQFKVLWIDTAWCWNKSWLCTFQLSFLFVITFPLAFNKSVSNFYLLLTSQVLWMTGWFLHLKCCPWLYWQRKRFFCFVLFPNVWQKMNTEVKLLCESTPLPVVIRDLFSSPQHAATSYPMFENMKGVGKYLIKTNIKSVMLSRAHMRG